MAVARDGVAASTGSATAFTLSLSHDAGSGTDRFLVVALHSLTDDITSVAYAAVPMTLLKKDASGRVQLWGLADPPGGTNNLVISNSGFHYMAAVIKCYTGVDESTIPDSTSASTDNAIFATSLTMSTTTVADNAWTFYAIVCANTSSAASAGTGSNLVGQLLSAGGGTNGSISLFDSNGPHTPAGAKSMQATHGSSTNFYGSLLSLEPETDPPPPPSNNSMLLLCG